MFHGANESYKDDSAPSGIIHCTLIFAHLQRCRKKRVKREVEKKKKTDKGKDKENPLILRIYREETTREGKTTERLSETYNYLKLTFYGQ